MAASPPREPLINKLFHAARLFEASDLYLDVGTAPRLRILGDIRHVHCRPLTQDDLVCAVSVVLDGEQLERLGRGSDIVVTYTCPEGVTYRVSVFNNGGQFSLWAHRLSGGGDPALHSSATATADPG